MKFAFNNLARLRKNAPSEYLTGRDRVVIFSDLHMGNGKDIDDFQKNGDLFSYILENHYLKKKYKLVLNGDIEELHKFSLSRITQHWAPIYSLFERFKQETALYKLIGNHDYYLIHDHKYPFYDRLFPAIRFFYHNNELFIFHGHQASSVTEKYNWLFAYLLRFIVKPLGFKNYSTAYSSNKKYKVEKKVHAFSNVHRIISIIGHTHRPLFESLSKIDTLKFKIEQLLREFTSADPGQRKNLAQDIKHFRKELLEHYKKDSKIGFRDSLYDAALVIPCVFNSGSGIGKRGITAIEISKGKIALVYWYATNKIKPYLKDYDNTPIRLEDSPYYRLIIKEDQMEYIFTRIRLLAY
jgi:UDP-2,3-diacylglucosamine pyrophosphatase LpxH